MTNSMKEYSAKQIAKKIHEYADLENRRMLEIGCGEGRISSRITSDSTLLVAIDPDEKAIKKASTNVSGVDFRIGTGEAIDFPDSFFDVVIFTLSLHHQNSKNALSEAKRVLKSDGKILIIEPIAESEIERIFSFLQNEDKEKAVAQECICNSELKVIDSEIFTSFWVFENEKDLLNYVFDHYSMTFNSNIANNISDYLGSKVKSSPIVCEDKMIIQSLCI